jgi:hypothetical protein
VIKGSMADNKQFLADVSKFVDLTTRDMLLVAKESLQDVIRDAQTPVGAGGQMPVDTGFLRNSLTVEVRGSQVAEGGDSYTLGIAQLNLGDPISFAWTAQYAIPRHYAVGVGQGGGAWRDIAAAKWSSIVTVNANKLRAMR